MAVNSWKDGILCTSLFSMAVHPNVPMTITKSNRVAPAGIEFWSKVNLLARLESANIPGCQGISNAKTARRDWHIPDSVLHREGLQHCKLRGTDAAQTLYQLPRQARALPDSVS